MGSESGKKLVVVIDDSEIVLAVAEVELDAAGYEVVTMTEPSAEIRGIEADLVLVDINMPQFFGDDATRFLKDVWQVSAPIYLYSSINEDELRRRTERAGADGYICKEWGKERLVSIVDELLSGEGE